MLRCSVSIDKQPVKLLIDSKASHNFVSLSFVKKNSRFQVKSAAILTVQLADGSKLHNQGIMRMKVDLGAKLKLEIDF